MDSRIFCRREDLTVFAVYDPKEWFALRAAGTLDADLKRRRESGVVIEVAREPEKLVAPHEPPRAGEGMRMHNPTGVDARMANWYVDAGLEGQS